MNPKEKEQLKQTEQIEKLKNKKRQLKDDAKGKRRDPNSSATRKFNKRIQAKVESRSRPTKGKIIFKDGKNGKNNKKR
jgi:vacuolar-type H+-ATPase subunit H